MPRPPRLRPAPLIIAATFVASVALPSPARAVHIQEVRSPGGIVAWLVEEHGIPVVALEATFRGGAALDPAGKEGLANMAAALLDEGAGELESQAYHARLEDLSIRLGADAGRDDFAVGLKTLKANEGEAFRLLALTLAAPRFDADAVARVRSQIEAELARESDEPRAVASRTFWRTLFPEHSYGRPVEGTPESVGRIAVEDLRAFAAARLARGNLVLGVVGDITAMELGPLLDRAFGGLPAAPAVADVPEARPGTSGQATIIEKDVPQSTVLFAQRGPKREDPQWYAAEVVIHILGGGMTSRLFQEVREERGLAYSVWSALAPLDHAGLIQGGLGTENAHVGEAIERVRAAFRRMRDEGPTQAELDAAKTYLTGAFPLRFDSTAHTARILVAMQLDHLGIDYIDRHDRLIAAVTLDEARRFARETLDPDHLTFVVVGKPGKGNPS